MNLKQLIRDLCKKDNLKELVKTHNIQYWVGLGFAAQSSFTIDKNVFDVVGSHGLLFYTNDQIHSVLEVFSTYEFDDIREDDVVVDIGANVGAFSMVAARKAKQVYAIEPIFQKELLANIALNKLTNIKVIGGGIGKDKSIQTIEYGLHSNRVPIMPFQSFKAQLPDKHIDFLKIDCEGYEWSIEPESFEGIRRIEAEIHIRKAHREEDTIMLNRWLEWFKLNKYTYNLGDWADFSGPFLRMGLIHVELTT
jgi:FkbM family methyltransferase